ncbi:HAD-IIIC family phosphatase [Murimonas intestini]|uniref:HAD superfamily phosphatase (TIGR01681 family)/FkbH-like protein n=1 Tax=Murimonas intestini TaxID=1337051 RepID=A0AB73T5K2_9FIRM|nr:HAD-IIIC family phosphatase [Murimonas intestini]MCR1840686.1 HAD-IIIC family phosphatase [Murimonas intestini]MCR1865261.1 HAD-IIIC family phosphatase [Murimonas intestini]MCR1883025.1 HAD-IIIC family phosphatase [Murimonas intestini]
MEKEKISELLKQVRKNEKNNVQNEGVKIAVLGSCSIQYFVKILRYYLNQNGVQCNIYEGEYSGINMDVFDPNSSLYEFNPEYVIMLPFYSDVKECPPLLSEGNKIIEYLDDVKKYYEQLWSQINGRLEAKILQANFVLPPVRVLGNLEYQKEYGRNEFLYSVNRELLKVAPSTVTIVDVDALSNNVGKYNWFDYKAYFLNKAAVRLDYMPEYVMCFVHEILALRGNIRKCLVLDLDNTLWGGVVGDEGWEGIQIDSNNAVGEAYRYFQQYCLELKQRGIILAVCSKNDEATAKEPFEKNENMILKLDDISCFIANWENKADNIRRIAQELNIGTDSLVFFDDNPAERQIVREFVPEVHVIDVPQDPALYVLQMEKEQPFEWTQITKEDLERTNSYIENQKRQKMQESFVDYNEYLKALEMKGHIGKIENVDIPRFSQLINKSNQFNLRTIRYQEANIIEMVANPDYRCLYCKLSDKYSNYGIISCVILHKEGSSCFIDTWVMSCRVLKRGVEDLMFNAITDNAKAWGCSSIRAEYLPTKKNKMVESFYEGFEFELTSAKNGTKEYILNDLNNVVDCYIEEE